MDKIIGRRVRKKVTEYEVQWVGLRPEQNLWLTRDRIVEMGCGKLCAEFDAKEAARQVHFKALTSDVIIQFCADFGIERETCNFTRIGSLSGGQKVKVRTWATGRAPYCANRPLPHVVLLFFSL